MRCGLRREPGRPARRLHGDQLPFDSASRPPWHTLTAAAVLAALDTDAGGLSSAEAALRLAARGANRLPEARTTPLWLVFARQFKSPLIYLLVAAAVVSLGIGAFDDVLFIAAVLLINAVIGTTQEWRAERSARALQQYVEARTTVRRDGRPRQIPAANLVPGDIVRVAAGSRVPADLRLLTAAELQLDESLLTGESTAVPKRAEAQLAAGAGIADRANMLHAGALVLTGRADAGEGYRPAGAIRRDDGADPTPEQWAALRRLAACGLLCNDADYRPGDDGGVEHFGDTVDVALQALAAKLGLRRDDLLAQRPERTVIPFESTRRFAAAVHDTAGRPVAYVKGAAETVLRMCDDTGAVAQQPVRGPGGGGRPGGARRGHAPAGPERDPGRGAGRYLALAGRGRQRVVAAGRGGALQVVAPAAGKVAPCGGLAAGGAARRAARARRAGARPVLMARRPAGRPR